jgi:hypothetical protein
MIAHRSVGVAMGAALLALATAFGQDAKKPDSDKPRLPNNWRPLELTEEQKQQYYKLAKERDQKLAALKSDMQKLRTKLNQMKKEFDDLDSGDAYLAILTPAQKEKFAALKIESAKKSAEKAAKKAKEMANKKGKAAAEEKKKPSADGGK